MAKKLLIIIAAVILLVWINSFPHYRHVWRLPATCRIGEIVYLDGPKNSGLHYCADTIDR